MISDEKLRKKERLLKSGDFRIVFKEGRSAKAGALILYARPNGLGYNRLGFSIAARNIKLAARRNKIKRVLKEVFRRGKASLKKGFDLVVVAKRDVARASSYDSLKNLFVELTKRTGLAL